MHIFVRLKRIWDRKLSSGSMMSGQLNSFFCGFFLSSLDCPCHLCVDLTNRDVEVMKCFIRRGGVIDQSC